MINLKEILANPKKIIDNLNLRNIDFSTQINDIVKFAKVKKENDILIEKYNLEINIFSKDYQTKKNEIINLKSLKTKCENDSLESKEKIEKILLNIPNLISEKTPIGKNESDNKVVKSIGKITSKAFLKPHWEIIESNLNNDQTVKISGTRFAIYKSELASLHRAVSNFFLDEAIKENYIEIKPPVIVSEQSLKTTGQLPKFQEDLYQLNNSQFLSPTGEVQLVNLFQNSLIKEKLPINLCCLSSCFRKEAGAAGKDTRGIIRLHEFTKVELVKIVEPTNSSKELLKIVNHSSNLLKKLKLPHKIIALCSGDIGFSAHQTFDIEVYMAGQKLFREISSCSNCLDFQAIRGNIKYVNDLKKNVYVHTLNGSGLAVDRTVAAIVEHYQNKDKSVTVPTVLKKYLNHKKIFFN